VNKKERIGSKELVLSPAYRQVQKSERRTFKGVGGGSPKANKKNKERFRRHGPKKEGHRQKKPNQREQERLRE